MMSFDQLQRNMRARVSTIEPNPATLRLQEMGLTVGTEFSVAKVAPFGDTIEIRLRGYSLCLRKCEAAGIEVELI
ncbi:MAG: FeoA domain-containing protein [Fimbriimonadaceae bacterium]